MAITHDPEDPQKMREKIGGEVKFDIYTDPDMVAIEGFGVLDEAVGGAFPAAFIVSTDGKIVWKHVGEKASETPDLDTVIAELKKLPPPPP